MKHPVIRDARYFAPEINGADGTHTADQFQVQSSLTEHSRSIVYNSALLQPDIEEDDSEDGEGIGSVDQAGTTVTFMIKSELVQEVKRTAILLSYPLMEEYDFRADKRNGTLDLHIKSTTKITNYQEKSLAKMFGNGRARSGLIVLPCGSGEAV